MQGGREKVEREKGRNFEEGKERGRERERKRKKRRRKRKSRIAALPARAATGALSMRGLPLEGVAAGAGISCAAGGAVAGQNVIGVITHSAEEAEWAGRVAIAGYQTEPQRGTSRD